MAASQHRHVKYMHRTLNRVRAQEMRIFGKYKNLTKTHAGTSHQAIFVFDVDPANELVGNYTRFELAIPEGPKGIVVMEVVHGTGNLGTLKGDGWRAAKRPWENENHGISGITSLENQRIAEIGDAIMEEKFKHGSYNVMINSCQQFALYLFNKICDIEGSKHAKVERTIAGAVHGVTGDKMRNLAIAGAIVGATVFRQYTLRGEIESPYPLVVEAPKVCMDISTKLMY